MPSAVQGLYVQPTFRAGNSNTSRYPTEFWTVEPETIVFADLLASADLAEVLLKCIFITAVLKERADDMVFFAQRIDKTYTANGWSR